MSPKFQWFLVCLFVVIAVGSLVVLTDHLSAVVRDIVMNGIHPFYLGK